ncbi:MAG: hypothetical protein WKF43_13175 [Acidimicrobiales bacterium]
MRTATFTSGVPTSIGSLPHRDRDAAVAFILERHPELPAAPSLPALDGRESMLAQAAWGVAGITVAGSGRLSIESSLLDPDAPLGDPALAGVAFATFRRFLVAVSDRTAPIKLQLTGPITLGLALFELGIDADLAFRIASRAVHERAVQVLAAAAEHTPARSLVVFIDEPGLSAAARPDFPLSTEETIDLVSGALAVIEPHAVTGLHCCGPADWRALLQAGPQILSLPVEIGPDVESGIVASGSALNSFFERGGWVAWGAVPTGRPLGPGAGRPWRVLSTQWRALVEAGCDPVRLRRQALITPPVAWPCTARATPRVLELTRDLAARLQDPGVGVTLSVGA